MTVYANLNLGASVWLGIPVFGIHPSVPDAPTWARWVAENTWRESGLPYQPDDVDRLTAVLNQCAEKWGPHAAHAERLADPGLEIHTALYLPDPRDIPFPARIYVANAAMVVNEKLTLRDLVDAEDPRAINPPQVHSIENPALGTGLKAYRLRAMENEPGQPKDYDHPVYAVIRYAFNVPGHDDKIVTTVSWPDIALLTKASEDIDNLARGLTFEYHPDEADA